MRLVALFWFVLHVVFPLLRAMAAEKQQVNGLVAFF